MKDNYEGKYCDCTGYIIVEDSICVKCKRPFRSKNYQNGEKKSKLLFVDDRTKRIHHALNNFPEFDVTIATCFLEAMREMCKRDWDVVSLDHDFMGVDFQDPDTPTCGMEIVRYLEKTGWPPQRKVPEFWVHSSNLFAAHLMVLRLTRAGFDARYKPIIYKTENMKYDETGLPIP